MFGPPDIEKMESEGNVRGLARALRYRRRALRRNTRREAPYIREAAARALGHLGDTRAVGPLRAALVEGESNLRAVAAQALGRIGSPDAVDCLRSALDDQSLDVRAAAAKALFTVEENAEPGSKA